MIDISHARKDHVHTDLLERVAEGDYEAFAALYFDLYRPVQRYAQMLLTDTVDAQNVAAAVFVEMWHTARLRTPLQGHGSEGHGSERHGSERHGSERHGCERHGSERQTVLRWALTITRRRCLKRPRPLTGATSAKTLADKHLTCQLGVLLAAAGAGQATAC